MKNILNSFISWVGGKKALREEIYQIFPKDHKKYAEVFGGGGWVLFGKRQRPGCIEVYNDFNGDLVNLFLCVRDKCLPLLEELGFLPLNSRDEYRLLKKFLKKESFPNGYLYENLELADRYLPEPSAREIKEILTIQAEQYDVRRAAAYYKSIRYSYSSGGSSYGARPLNIRDFFGLFWSCSRRLARVVIEHKDFESLIAQYKGADTLFYCDPPYYDAECYEVAFPKEDHRRLRDALKDSGSRWVVSYNDVPFIRELYKGYYIFPVTRLDNQRQRYAAGAEYAEVIITNFEPTDYPQEPVRQLTLFDEPEGKNQPTVTLTKEMEEANEHEN